MGKTLGQIAFGVWVDTPSEYGQDWEAAAAAVAAVVRSEMGWRPIAEATESKELLVGGWEEDGYWDTDMLRKHTAIDCGYTHYLLLPDQPQEPKR